MQGDKQIVIGTRDLFASLCVRTVEAADDENPMIIGSQANINGVICPGC